MTRILKVLICSSSLKAGFLLFAFAVQCSSAFSATGFSRSVELPSQVNIGTAPARLDGSPGLSTSLVAPPLITRVYRGIEPGDGRQGNGPVAELVRWGQLHGIGLVGIEKPVNYFYYGVATEKDFISIEQIPNIGEVIKGLYRIPVALLPAMKDKVFYLSQLQGRGYTVLGSWPEQGILRSVKRGCILEQPLSQRQTIHEFAHILDFHGIQGLYGDKNDHWTWLKELRNDIFAVPFVYDRKLKKPPAGYMDIYSTANPAENFAQHFMYYILHGAEFRKRAKGDGLLQQKYDFFSDFLFQGKEY